MSKNASTTSMELPSGFTPMITPLDVSLNRPTHSRHLAIDLFVKVATVILVSALSLLREYQIMWLPGAFLHSDAELYYLH